MDILVVYVEIEVAVFNLRENRIKASANLLGILFRNHALTGEHERMRLRAFDVGLPHALVNGQRSAKGLRELGGRILEAPTPECLVHMRAFVRR